MPGLTLGNNPTTKLDQSTCCDSKRNPATPNSNESKESNNQNNKLCQEAHKEQPKFDKKAIGMFRLRP